MNDLSLDHAAHDELLVVAFAGGDVAGPDVDDARRLVDACQVCARLHDDVRALVAATAALPASRRPRDFRLTEADAARLRPRGWRGIVAALAGPRFAYVQPLGGALAALGLAGLLLAAIPSVLPQSGVFVTSDGARMTAPEAERSAAGPAASGASTPAEQAPVLGAASASAAAGQAVPAPVSSPSAPEAAAPNEAQASQSAASDAKASGGVASGSDHETATAASPRAGSAPVPAARPAGGPDPSIVLAAGSLALLLVGAGLFLIARSAHRTVGS